MVIKSQYKKEQETMYKCNSFLFFFICVIYIKLIMSINSINYNDYYLRYWSIADAAFLPAPIANITVAAPVTASPPA